MKRLTARNKRGIAYYPTCVSEEKKDCNQQCHKCSFDAQVCHRLAEYEDLGVTPEQIRKIDELYSAKCRQVALFEDINNQAIALLQETSNAITTYREKRRELERIKEKILQQGVKSNMAAGGRDFMSGGGV